VRQRRCLPVLALAGRSMVAADAPGLGRQPGHPRAHAIGESTGRLVARRSRSCALDRPALIAGHDAIQATPGYVTQAQHKIGWANRVASSLVPLQPVPKARPEAWAMNSCEFPP